MLYVSSYCCFTLHPCRPIGYERVHLPLYKVADAPFHIQEDDVCGLMQTEQHIIENSTYLIVSDRVCYPGRTFIIDILLSLAEPAMFKAVYDMLNYFS